MELTTENSDSKSRKLTFWKQGTLYSFFLKKELSPVEFSVQQDIYDRELIEAKEDFVHGNFEVVPGVSADEYIQRFKKGNDFQTLTHSAWRFVLSIFRPVGV